MVLVAPNLVLPQDRTDTRSMHRIASDSPNQNGHYSVELGLEEESKQSHPRKQADVI